MAAIPVSCAARLLLLGLPIWSPGGLHRHILSAAKLRNECEGVVGWWNAGGDRKGEVV